MIDKIRPKILSFVILLVVLLAAGSMGRVRAQQPSPTPAPDPAPQPKREALSEADPTRPMLFVIRNEYRDLKNGAWASTLLFRHDRFAFRNLGVKGGAKGFVLRFDVPLNTVHAGGVTKFGLGDIYAQVLLIPRIRRTYALSVGTGLTLPTATSTTLGTGKVIVSPVFVPLWYLARRSRLVTLRIQHFVSVAGNGNRPNVNYTVIDPFVGIAAGRRSWVFTNTEFKWDWRTKLNSAVTGVQVGRMISDNMGFWIKPEVPWGPGRSGGFNIKVGLFRFR